MEEDAQCEGLGAYLGLAKDTLAVKNTRAIGKRDLKLNDATPQVEVHPETYEVRADGELLICEPAEVLPMAQEFVARQLMKMRCQPIWREGFTTDNGNHVLDIHDLCIPNPLELVTRLNLIPGVVTVGIFAQRAADVLLIAGENGVRELRS